MVNMCLEIETTRDIARQILRHRSFSFQEFSQRYADPLVDLHFSVREARLQDPKNRQNSIPLDLTDFGKGGNKTQQELLQEKWMSKQTEIIDLATRTYRWAIDNGIAKEVARAVLPEGNTMSRMYMNGTLRSWVHYIELRKENGTQLEHMRIAQECANVISEVFPIKDYI
jgi:thymidylate synthase (FAD)